MAILLHYVFNISWGAWRKQNTTTHDALKLNTEAWARLHRSLLKWRWRSWAQVGPVTVYPWTPSARGKMKVLHPQNMGYKLYNL